VGASLIELILLTEKHQEFSSVFKSHPKGNEIVQKLTHGVEDNILSKDFADSESRHRLRLISVWVLSIFRLWLFLWSLLFISTKYSAPKLAQTSESRLEKAPSRCYSRV
jgi:hypothetical protein